MNCLSTQYPVTLAACPDTIFLRAGLLPNTLYYWAMVNKFGNVIMRDAMTDVEGVVTIPTTEFLPGTFNEFAGSFELSVSNNAQDPVKMTFAGNEYDSVVMDFKTVDAPAGVFNNIIE
jgi:hypothetical protein